MPQPRRRQTDAADALAAVAPLASRWIERLLAGHDPSLTIPQYLVLRAIAREEVGGAELARRAGVSAPAVSQLLAGLADAGLVERRPVPGDRRRQALALTRDGGRAFEAAQQRVRDELATLLADLPKPEADALARVLPRVESLVSGAPPPRRKPHPPKRAPHPHER
jgi:DNA-binding MarR family transcriptional regulator